MRLRTEDLTIAQERNRRTILAEPATGIVQQLQVYTIGAVVRPGDPLLVVAPERSTLVVDSKKRKLRQACGNLRAEEDQGNAPNAMK